MWSEWSTRAVFANDARQMKVVAGSLGMLTDMILDKHDVNTYLNLLAVDGSVVLVG